MEQNNYNTYVQDDEGELQEGFVISADKVEEYTSNNYILLPEGDYDFTIVDMKISRHIDKGGKVGNCKQVNPVFRIVDPESGTPVDISNHNLYVWNSDGCKRMITQYFVSIWDIPKGQNIVMNFSKEKNVGCTGKLRIKHEKYKGNDGTERTSMKIARLYRKEPQAPAGSTGNWGWKG